MSRLGAAGGALLTVPLLNDFAANVGRRIAFGLGVVLGLGILIVRHVPESPRRLFIHGRDREAEELVDGIEEEVEREKGVGGIAGPRSIAVAMARFVSSATRTGSLIR
ncbi:MFS transporter [Streptosporangium canum]|uniref:MFS transporter n=1 Tax=Streptosporangium canum TaxID=324952 RepID=UPI0036745985